tara:strand:+ start:167 stop:343 length:177 start_codon:yes stop_codon:yes gene_type:complete
MSYFLGAIFPFFMLGLGLLFLVSGLDRPNSSHAIAGAILLSGVLIAFSINNQKLPPKP